MGSEVESVLGPSVSGAAVLGIEAHTDLCYDGPPGSCQVALQPFLTSLCSYDSDIHCEGVHSGFPGTFPLLSSPLASEMSHYGYR